MTPSEVMLWQALRRRQLGVRFRRQEPIGPYVADFVALEASLVIEVDGDHHRWDYVGSDDRRDHYLRQRGYRVVRFWGNEVISFPDEVVATIKACLADPDFEPERLPHE